MESDLGPGLGPSLSPFGGETLTGEARKKGSTPNLRAQPLFSLPTKSPENLSSQSWAELEGGFDYWPQFGVWELPKEFGSPTNRSGKH